MKPEPSRAADPTPCSHGSAGLPPFSGGEHQLRAILDNLFSFVGLLDPEGIVQEMNRPPLEAAGLRMEEVLGKPFADCYWWSHSREVQERIRDAVARGAEGDVSRFDVDIRVAEDRRMSIDFMLAPIRNDSGEVTHLLPSGVDITDRRQTELALRCKTEELSLVNRELEAFSYSVSHDLLSPLRAINGFSSALREEYGYLLPAEGHHYLDRVHNATLRMGQLIDGLLNLSQVIRSELRVAEVDLSRMAAHIADALREGEPRRGIAFHIQPSVVAAGDPALLQVLLENLLANAWKFTSQRDRGRIEFGQVTLQEQAAYFVRDNGVGFDMNFAHRLFQPFERLHNPGEFAGMGIGLATVRRIVERHGGRVWAESGIDRGTTIYFCLA